MPQEWTPVALLAQLHVYYRQHNGWPTLQDLTLFTQLSADRVRALLDILVDRRLVKVEGETVFPWEAGPSPVVTYRLSPEEIAARYGPPNRYKSRAAALQAAASELVGCWPQRPAESAREADSMPRGIHISWPPDAELLAMADEIKARGGDVLGELAERFGCSTFTIKRQLRLARRALRTAEQEPAPANGPTTAHEEADEMAHVDWPDSQTLLRMAEEIAAEGRNAAAVIAARLGVHPGTVRKKLQEARREAAAESIAETPDPGEAPAAGELMLMAEEEASRIVEASVAAPEPRSVDEGTATLPGEETPASGPQDASEQGDLSTFQHLILVSPTEVRVELVHITMAPEMPGDEWPEIVRVDGRRQVRIWSCIGVQRVGDQPVAVMIPKGYAVVRVHEVHERRTA